MVVPIGLRAQAKLTQAVRARSLRAAYQQAPAGFRSTQKRVSASESAIRRLSAAGGGFRGSNAGFAGFGGGGGVARFPTSRAPGRSVIAPQGTTAAAGRLGSRGGFELGQTAGYEQPGGGGEASNFTPGPTGFGGTVTGAGGQTYNVRGGVGGGAGIAQSPAQRAQQAFLQLLNRARGERGRQAGEGRALRGMSLQDLSRLISTPAMRPETVRRIQGEQIGSLRGREASINRETREALARGGLLTGGRGVELARRTRAEMGPAGARAIGQVQSQAELANQQAIRQGLSARAQFTGSLPVVGEDMTSELQLLAESANLQGARESGSRQIREILDARRRINEQSGVTGRTAEGLPELNLDESMTRRLNELQQQGVPFKEAVQMLLRERPELGRF